MAEEEADDEPECPICSFSRDGSALSSDDVGSEVWVRDGVLSRKPPGQGPMEVVDVVWEGDDRALGDNHAAARPANMHGFVKSALGKMKSRVELAPTLVLAMAKGGQLHGISFENPRRLHKGIPVTPEAQFCYCVFHHHCIREWKAKGVAGQDCPICKRDLNTPMEHSEMAS